MWIVSLYHNAFRQTKAQKVHFMYFVRQGLLNRKNRLPSFLTEYNPIPNCMLDFDTVQSLNLFTKVLRLRAATYIDL